MTSPNLELLLALVMKMRVEVGLLGSISSIALQCILFTRKGFMAQGTFSMDEGEIRVAEREFVKVYLSISRAISC